MVVLGKTLGALRSLEIYCIRHTPQQIQIVSDIVSVLYDTRNILSIFIQLCFQLFLHLKSLQFKILQTND